LGKALVRAAFKLLIVALAAPAVSAAQDRYPTKPIRWIVPSGTGSFDSLTRALATQMSLAFGQPIIVENRPAAGGVVGMDQRNPRP